MKTLLIVDDERGVLDAMRHTLEPSGYRMILTTDPGQALQLLKTDCSIDVLITDLFMPSMHGSELLAEGRRLRPGLGAILTTGIASSVELRRWRGRGELVVAKPWREGELLGMIEKAFVEKDSAYGAKKPGRSRFSGADQA